MPFFVLKGCDNCSDDLYLLVLGLCLSETWAESNVQELVVCIPVLALR